MTPVVLLDVGKDMAVEAGVMTVVFTQPGRLLTSRNMNSPLDESRAIGNDVVTSPTLIGRMEFWQGRR